MEGGHAARPTHGRGGRAKRHCSQDRPAQNPKPSPHLCKAERGLGQLGRRAVAARRRGPAPPWRRWLLHALKD